MQNGDSRRPQPGARSGLPDDRGAILIEPPILATLIPLTRSLTC